MIRFRAAFVLFVLVALTPLRGDLQEIRSEPNLERRSRLAMEHAAASFAEAKSAYAAGDLEKTAAQLKSMQEAVEISRDALESTGRDAHRHTKPFKFAETITRDLLRKLDGLEKAMDVDDRKLVEGPKTKIQEVHDQWLNDIITGRR